MKPGSSLAEMGLEASAMMAEAVWGETVEGMKERRRSVGLSLLEGLAAGLEGLGAETLWGGREVWLISGGLPLACSCCFLRRTISYSSSSPPRHRQHRLAQNPGSLF